MISVLIDLDLPKVFPYIFFVINRVIYVHNIIGAETQNI